MPEQDPALYPGSDPQGRALEFLRHIDARDETYLFEQPVTPLEPVEMAGATHYPFATETRYEASKLVFRRIMIADMVGDNPVGFSTFGYDKYDDGRTGMPAVVYTETLEGERRHGYGLERYRAMNEVALRETGLPLYSDADEPSDEARATWQKLVQNDLAEQFENDESEGQFRFIAPQAPRD